MATALCVAYEIVLFAAIIAIDVPGTPNAPGSFPVSYTHLDVYKRQAVYFAALFILPALWGAEAAFYAEAISDVIGPLTSIAIHALVMKKLLARRAI